MRHALVAISAWAATTTTMLRPPRSSEVVEVILLTDRLFAASATFNSICAHTSAKVQFDLVVPDKRIGHVKKDLILSECGKDQYELWLVAESQMVESIHATGLGTGWEEPVPKTELTVHPASWDASAKHNSVFNILRFFLSRLREFADKEMVVFVDDDVVVQGDIAHLWTLPQPLALSAGCLNWVWNGRCGRMEGSITKNYLDVPYFGFGPLSAERSVEDATCRSETQDECMPPGFLESLANASERINGQRLTVDALRRVPAWNFGINKFNLTAWRDRGLTERYIAWTHENNRVGWFPHTSLAYGLGLAFLSLAGEVSCVDDKYPFVMHGLGHVEADELGASFDMTAPDPMIDKAFALHWNGDRKPWDFYTSIDAYRNYFLDYTPLFESTFQRRQSDLVLERQRRARDGSAAFVVWTMPRSGSEWFMSMLDHHPNVCASGEVNDPGRGWPREGLQPLREPREYSNVCRPKAACHWTITMRLLSDLMNEGGGQLRSFPASCETLAANPFGSPRNTSKYGLHHSTMCKLLARALRRAEPLINNRNLVLRHAHHIFLRHQLLMGESDGVPEGDEPRAAYAPLLATPLKLPCSCPRNTTTAGLKFMTGWVRYPPPHDLEVLTGNNSALRSIDDLTGSYLDIFASFGAIKAKAVVLDRWNLMAAFLSLLTAQQSKQFHCTNLDECYHVAPLYVDAHRLVAFLKRNIGQRNARDSLLSAFGVSQHHVRYEDCVDDPRTCFKGVLDFLEVDTSPRVLNKLLEAHDFTRTSSAPFDKRIANYQEVAAELAAAGYSYYLNGPGSSA